MKLSQLREIIKEELKNLLEESNDVITVLTDEDYESLDDATKATWKGYHYKMAYEVVTPESAEEGDAEERGWSEEKSSPCNSIEELLKDNDIKYKSWTEWSSTNPSSRDWLTSEPDQDFQSGADTSYSLWVVREDGKPLSKEELQYIGEELGVSSFGRMF